MISRIIQWAVLHCRRQHGRLNVRLPIGKTVRKNKRMIICLSLIMLAVNMMFLYFNYNSLKGALYFSLTQKAEQHEVEFKLNLKMAYSSLLQISTLISGSPNHPLLKDSKAASSPPAENNASSASRRKTYQFGSVENKPYLLVENKQGYSWQNGVVPIWAVDPETQTRVYAGALEVSTSFKEIVPLYSKLFRVEAAMLLNKDYVRSKMWNADTKAYFERHPEANHYVEVTTSLENLQSILAEQGVASKIMWKNYKTDTAAIVYKNGVYYSVYYFPLPDSQATEDAGEQHGSSVGFILIWEDVSEQVMYYAKNFLTYIIVSLLVFMLIEIGLLWILNRETRLSVAEQCAAVDELTGLFNRRYLDDLLDNELRRTKQFEDVPLSLIICDVDYFKRFNDTYGHKAGDECLKKIADALRLQARRSSDCVARYGGEEFVIVLPRTDLHSAADIAEWARRAIINLAIPHASSDIVPVVTITLGVACTSNLAEYESLFEAADRNLYIAKNNGRNRVEPTKMAIPPRKLH